VNYRAGRLEEIPPESREVFANGISVCLAGQQLWITTKRAARAPISASVTSRGPALAGGRSPSMAASGTVAGRRDPDHLRPGDALDFWRVEAIEPGHLLRLRAEMKLPGLAGIVTRRTCRADGLPAARHVPFTWPGRPALLARVAVTACHIVFGGMARNITGQPSTPGRSPIRAQIVPKVAGMAAVVRHAQRQLRGQRGCAAC
jgi:hypothetical protein